MSTALAKVIGRTPGPVTPTQRRHLKKLVDHSVGVRFLEYGGRVVGEDHPWVQRTRRLLAEPERYDEARAAYYARELIRLREAWRREHLEDGGDYFGGGCPECGFTDGYTNRWKNHFFFCQAHRTRWWGGYNLFSSWRYETKEEQRARWDALGLDTFREVTPVFGEDPARVRSLRARLGHAPATARWW